MRQIRIITILFFLCLIIIACSQKENTMIQGKWTGTEWLVNGHPSELRPEAAIFTFNPDGKYSFEYDGSVENGSYFVSNDELFTTPDGGIKMMVKIPRLTQDTLVFDKNRGGQSERLTLKRN